ncbi:MAG: hypothetical protein ICV66_13420, partial [Chitinophagaceae bacterium]|nr:hypothetical protein [Chitinophagaceae bacterium]
MNRSYRARRFLFFLPLFFLGVLVFGWIVMLLWNNVASPVLHISTVTFWQALGILVLSKILFSSFTGRGGYSRDYRKQKLMWNSMTPEQQQKFKEEWKNRCRKWGYRAWDSDT